MLVSSTKQRKTDGQRGLEGWWWMAAHNAAVFIRIRDTVMSLHATNGYIQVLRSKRTSCVGSSPQRQTPNMQIPLS